MLDCEHATPKHATTGYPYIAIPDIRDGRLDLADVRLISMSDFERWTRRTRPRAGDIIVTRRGRVGDSAVIPPDLECAIGQNLVIVRSDGSQVDQTFLRWALRSPAYYTQVNKYLNVGAVFDSLNVRDFPQFEVPIPPMVVQRAIAGVLGALDDMIEMNRRMNETLNAVAEAIYGNLLQSTHHVARVGDLLELAYGKALKASDRRHGSVLVYGSNGVVGRHDEALSTGPGIIVGRKGNPGVVTWTDESFYAIDTTFYVVPRLSEASLYHLYFALRRLDLPSFAADSAVPGLNRNIAYGLEIEFPEAEALQRFDDVVAGLFAKRAANERESRTLAELRDTLLPKLISGELRVRDAEAAVEQST